MESTKLDLIYSVRPSVLVASVRAEILNLQMVSGDVTIQDTALANDVAAYGNVSLQVTSQSSTGLLTVAPGAKAYGARSVLLTADLLLESWCSAHGIQHVTWETLRKWAEQERHPAAQYMCISMAITSPQRIVDPIIG